MQAKVGFISLGCDKNRVESEYMISLVSKEFNVVDTVEEADVVIINTCAFIQSAVQESIDTIMDAASYGVKIIVTGCLPMRYRDMSDQELLPEVSAFLDNQHYADIVSVVYTVLEDGKKTLKNHGVKEPMSGERVLTTPMHYANLRIADGCDNACAYCAIPKIRGGYRAVPPQKLYDEARSLMDNYGTKEFILVAQDVTRYASQGVDLLGLIEGLEKAGVPYMRLMYCYPELVTPALIQRIAHDPHLAPYLDLPLQHIDNDILISMNRKSRETEIRALLERLKAENITVRSTFISGFPGESEQAHQKLLAFIKEGWIDYAGFFPYYREEGTAAYKMPNQIPQRVKKARVSQLSAAESEIVRANMQSLVGRTVSVTFDQIDYNKNLFVGHTERMHPEMDSKVYFKSAAPVEMGSVYNVRIDSVRGIDVRGKTV